MDKKRLKNIVAIIIGGLGLLCVACAVSPNFVSNFFYAGKNAQFVERGGLVGIGLLCTSLMLFFVRTDETAAAKTEKPAEQKPAAPPAPEKPAE